MKGCVLVNRPETPLINPKRAVIARTLQCRSCGYNLRGVRLESRCPECGLPVGTTVNEAIGAGQANDPDARMARQMGNNLLAVTLCILLCALLVALPTVVAALRQVEGWSDWLGSIRPGELLMVAAVVALAGVRPTWPFMRNHEKGFGERSRAAGRILAVGLIATTLVALGDLALVYVERTRATNEVRTLIEQVLVRSGYALSGALVFVGLQGLLQSVGNRSRKYREWRSGRQSTRLMIVALILVAVGTLAQLTGVMQRIPRLVWVGETVVLTCGLMIIIGAAYLVLNAWWIRSALRRPEVRLRDVVRIEPDTTSMAAEARVVAKEG